MILVHLSLLLQSLTKTGLLHKLNKNDYKKDDIEMALLKMVSSIVACTNPHPFDEEMSRWENEGGRPL